MAQTVVRAAQTSYTTDFTGGTMDKFDWRDVAPFMDAVQRQDTPFTNDLKKGAPGTDRKERTGIHSVMPRGTRVSGAVLATDVSLPVIAGHGVRFQQGHVLEVTKADNSASEVMWVRADPTPDALPVRRARGGPTALALAANDRVKIIGIAMPQLTDYPLAPVSNGTSWHNFFQEFPKHVVLSNQARKFRNAEYPSGDKLDRDMLQLGKDLKEDLENALISGRRQEGDPVPDAPDPAMFGGLRFFAEQSGNVFNLAGAALTIEALEEALITLDEAIGDKAGTTFLMNIRTKQIFNRLRHPMSYQNGSSSPSDIDTRFDRITTETGTYRFTHSRNIPPGEIYLYDTKGMEYAPFEGEDWKSKEVPTKGNYVWKGMSGTYTFRPGVVPGMALIRNFSTTLGDYPQWGVAPA